MLTFFRRYQKIFFLFTTIVIVSSFVFFGTFSTFDSGPKKAKEEALGKSIVGTGLTKQQVERMIRFLSSSQEDLKDDRVQAVNLLNDGVVEKDFLHTDLGPMLGEKYYPWMEKDVEAVVEKISSFLPYAHPTVDQMSTESVWSQFAQGGRSVLSEIKKHRGRTSAETFSVLTQAFIQQHALPPVFVKRVLYYQQGKGGETADPMFLQADFSLFGRHSLEDWFGKQYLSVVSQWILNVAAYAESQGYSVSDAEARQGLVQNLQRGIQMMSQDPSIQKIDLQQAFVHQLRRLGMEESECIQLWKQISLFRKLFHGVGQSVLLDPLLVEEYHQYAKQTAKIALYSMPRSLQMRDFSTCMQFQAYLEAVMEDPEVGLSQKYLPLSAVEAKYPELVQKEYEIEYQQIEKKQVASEIGLKETWDWQVQEENWTLLKKQFPVLAKQPAATSEERFAILESLPESRRLDVDRYARNAIVEKSPFRIQEALHRAAPTQKKIYLNGKSLSSPMEGIRDLSALMALLDLAQVGEEASEVGLKAQQKLSFYTGDGEHYYAIRVLQRGEKRVLSWEEAKSQGALEKIVDKKLQDAYPEVRKKQSAQFAQKEGGWKPLSEVKEKVGMVVWGDLIRSIDAEYLAWTGKEPSERQKGSAEFYARHRFLRYARQALGQLQQTSQTESQSPWAFQKEVLSAARGKKELFASDALFFMPDGQWSQVFMRPQGFSFFQMLEKEAPQEISAQEVEMLKEPLRQEVQRHLMRDMLEQIELKQAIHIWSYCEE